MIVIKKEISKAKLIADFIAYSKKDTESVLVYMQALPKYLESQVAIQVFAYQLSHYPKTIYWYSRDPKIQNLILRSGLKTKKFDPIDEALNVSNNNSKKLETSIIQDVTNIKLSETSSNDSITDESIHDLVNSSDLISKLSSQNKISQVSKNTLKEAQEDIDKHQVSDSNLIYPIQSIQLRKPSGLTQSHKNNLDTSIQNPILDPYKKDIQESKSSSASTKTKDSNKIFNSEFSQVEKAYKPTLNFSSDININQVEIPKPLDFDNIDNSKIAQNNSNFKDLLDKIEATQSSINKAIQKPEFSNTKSKPRSFKGLKDEMLRSNKKMGLKFPKKLPRVNLFKTARLAIIPMLLLAGIGALFVWQSPKTVYTIAYQKQDLSAQSEILIDASDLQSQVVEFTTTQEIPTESIQNVPSSTRAQGKFKIVNPGSRGTQLNNGDFILRSTSGIRLQVEPNRSIASTFSFPGNLSFENSNFEFTAYSNDASLVLEVGQRLKILNLRGDSVCGACYAQVSQKIAQTPATSFKYFSQTEADILLEQAKSDINVQFTAWSQDKNGTWFWLESWIDYSQIELAYSTQIGNPADSVSLSAKQSMTLKYLTQEQLYNLISKQNSDIESLLSTNNFQIVGEDENQVKVDYNYLSKQKLEKAKIQENLKDLSVQEVDKILEADYPEYNITVSKKEYGFNIFGIDAEEKFEFNKL